VCNEVFVGYADHHGNVIHIFQQRGCMDAI
jgi:hypothetical protein